MNIVKGVADFIKKSSGGHHSESSVRSQVDRFTLPACKFCFSVDGEESVLTNLWHNYEKATDKGEKKRMLGVFLKQFIEVYKTWEPPVSEEALDDTTSSTGEHSTVVGCSVGHPLEILVALIEEVKYLTSEVIGLNTSTMWTTDLSTVSTSVTISTEGLPLLEALMIIVRSVHNCRVFGYYGGLQKLIALLKAAVVQLKTIAGALSGDEALLDFAIKTFGFLQKLLVHVVSTICIFTDLNSNAYKRAQWYTHSSIPIEKDENSTTDSCQCFRVSLSKMQRWKQKVTMSVMEAGGLNWLVELLRVIKSLTMQEPWTNMSLQYLTMRALHSVLSENTCAQNHFRSVGGLEVLLDELGLLSNNVLASQSSTCIPMEGQENLLLGVFQLHILSLEVLREAVFMNLSNLLYLCENGRVHKFANSFCSLSFLLQDYSLRMKEVSVDKNLQITPRESEHDNDSKMSDGDASDLPHRDSHFNGSWKNYAICMSRSLCSFILSLEDVRSDHVEGSSSNIIPVSPAYGELSVKWFLRVLLVVFPCIEACSNQDESPSTHLRIFVYTLQRYIFHALRKVLSSSSHLLEVLRVEGLWKVFFSENFFFLGPTAEDLSIMNRTCDQASLGACDLRPISGYVSSQVNADDAVNLQTEVISLIEFAATLSGVTHNMPECSALLDALEQSAYNLEISFALAKSLFQILKLSQEKTVASFKEINAVSRVLKVAFVQVEESQKSVDADLILKEDSCSGSCITNTFSMPLLRHKNIEASIALFTAYVSSSNDAKRVVLHNTTAINYLFDLFWDRRLRNTMMGHILDLMKIASASMDDQIASLRLCSKYLETFNQVKEKEKDFADVSIDLLAGMRDLLLIDQPHYQELFRRGGCFLHVVSLLNGSVDVVNGDKLVMDVLQTLTSLLANNDVSKAEFKNLVGHGYRTLKSLLLDCCHGKPSEVLLNALIDMLVDGKFSGQMIPSIKNEDAIILYLSILQKSSDSLRQDGLNGFLQLLRHSISNRASCSSAGTLNFLLDWFSQEVNDNVILRMMPLIQVIGGHSISGRDIRKIFALLRSEKVAHRQQYCSLLMNSLLSMLNEKGPTAFFDLIRNDSGIILKTPMHWPVNKGFTFSCWLRVENFPTRGTMGLFAFLTENSRGCFSLLAEDKLFYKSINQKRHDVSLHVNLVRNKWHYLCITHSIGRAFSGASLLRCYIDGDLVSSERCRYPKVNDPLTNCAIGAKVCLPSSEEGNPFYSNEDVSPFLGQIGPVYLFSDSIPQEQVLAIYSLGPSYMYSFLDNEIPQSSDSCLSSGIFNAKDGLAAKMIFGLNAQASMKKALYNISPLVEHVLDKNSFEATLMDGTQLCSRRLLQQIIYCVGGISVFFPLFTQSHWYGYEEQTFGHTLPVTKEHLTAEVIELIASVLDENFLNQQQMHLVSGFSMMGFLLQSLPPQQLNMETLSALKHLFNVVVNCSWSELLVKDMISAIFLNPLVWVYTVYEVQRELYMFLIQQLDNNPRLLKCLCRLPRVFDIIHQCYCNSAKCVYSVGGKYLLHPIAEDVIGKRPCSDEIRKIRLLLLSLGEMSLRKNVEESDLKALVAFLEITQDMACVEDVLHMVIRGISQKPVLASFVEQINIIGGCHVFINLLQREYEPVRLLSLQLIGTLLVVIPSEKKGTKFFNIAVGRSKSLSEISRKNNLRMQSVLSAISDRIFRFPLTENLCTTLFDLLLGGASHKQVLRKQTPTEMQCVRGNVLQFSLPQILVLIFKCLSESKSTSQRIRIIGDLLDLVDSNPINIEALMEHGWIAWLATSMELDSVKNYRLESAFICDRQINEQHCVKQLFSVVLSHYIHYVKGGWQQLGETTTFLLMHFEQAGVSYHYLLRDIYEDIIRRLVDISVEENILASQPCRDNTLYLLRLLDELLLSEIDHKLPFPATCTEFSPDVLELEGFKDLSSALYDALQGEIDEKMSRNSPASNHSMKNEDFINDEDWWNLYDLSWILISELNGKGPRKMLLKSTSSTGPSLGQRARELVESLNIPAAEMAAVVSGGIGSALGGKSSRTVDKAMLLRGEKCPRVVVRLVVLYLCRAPLQRASRCVQQVIPLLPCLMMADDDLAKNQIQLFIWSLLAVRSEYGMLDGGTRFHVISHLIRETVSLGKSILAASAAGRDDSPDANAFPRELGAVHNLIQKDRVLAAASDESKCIKTFKTDRLKQLQELRARLDENLSMGSGLRKAFEDELQSCLSSIVASDESRRAAFQLPYNQELQSIAEKWMHIFRSLFDERGPWSAHPFPNHIRTHWKLDKTEDSWRRRLKLRRNYHFDENLCQPSSSTLGKEVAVSASESKSGSGLPIPEHMKRFLLKGIHKIINEGTVRPGDSDPESSSKAMYLREISDFQSPELVKGGGDQKGYVMKDSSLSVEANAGEILMSVPCVLITPKRKLAGRLAVMRTVVHFFGDFLIEGTAGSSVFHIFNSLNNSDSEKIEQSSATQNQKFVELPVNLNLNFERQNAQTAVGKHPKDVKCHRRWDVSKIKAVHWGRYLLQYTAIEIFFTNSIAPIFINFASNKIAKDVGSLIVTLRNELLLHKGSIRDRIGAISFVDRRVAQDIAEAARESWRRREMTNFEYLMILNTLAGRSYNDLTQYPVFPWVLADYSSATLDFNKSSTFRDLSKPVGALDLKRFEVFEDRYRNFSDSDIPSFYYGSHYSSTGIVLYYLVRLEPFTTLHRNLQGGKFDHADRLFQSIEGTYRNCLSNTSDVKELIPEFFYMPEFLVNSNSYHFGVKQDGEAIDNVCLPPWAKGSPEEFISRNREALESEYVSSNLHQWIDLVFGYKQRGKPAVEAANIFYYLTYEGAVDLESIEDDLQRSAVEDQIANFGQTPIQIFRKKHPRRGPPIPIAHPLQFAPTSVCLTSIISNKDQTSSPLLYVNILESSVVLVHQGLVMSVKMWLTTQLQSGGNFTFSGAQDPFSGIGYDILSPRKIGSPLADGIELGSQCFATLQTPSENFLISCGNWDNSFQIISLVDGRVVQSIRRHKDVVGTVAVSSDGSILATGSYETTVMVWEVCRPRAYEKRVRSNQSDIPRKEYVISETPFHVLCGHDDIVTCLHVSIELDIVVSGSKDGTCVFHTLREGRYVRSLRHPSGSTLSKLAVSHHGRVVLYSDDDLNLHLYSINGKHIATSESNGRLNCLELSACGEFLVCAGDQGQIVVRSMNSLDLVRKYTGIGKVITSLTVTAEECILAGTKDGKLLIYSIENPQVRKASVSNAKSKSTGAGSD